MTFDLEKARALAYQASEFKVWTPPGATGYGSDLNKYREWQAVVEICDKRYPESLDQIADLMQNCNSLRARARKAEAEIERLLADAEQYERVIEARLGVIDQQAARIQELEDALVEVKAEHNYGPQWKWTGAEKLKDDYRQSARKQLQAEGKIGPEDAKPRSWQITDERKAAILHCKRMLTFLKEDDAPCYDVEKIIKDESVLVAMLKEAEQE